ncbi:hypothetical protein [Thiocapsa rosea]|uniref:hypothetical protein n=1 Tax=Thiocapsa rosea TaxID=69360 RepID=UPI001B87527D|nr:hypothetical protein [Thiocapsa rosea]
MVGFPVGQVVVSVTVPAGIVTLLPENLSYDREAGFRLERVGNDHNPVRVRLPEDTLKAVGEQADQGRDAPATFRTRAADPVDRLR